MTNRKREFAKFFSGAAASDALSMMLAFSDLLPIHAFGITLMPKMNFIQIARAGTVSLLLGYYGWEENERRAP